MANNNNPQKASGVPDFRAKLRAFPSDEAKNYVYGPRGGGIMGILWETDGVIFPYTPSLNISQAVTYNSYNPLHANQDFQIYHGTPSFAFVVSGEFTVQNQRERQYAIAVIQFLRSVSKMRFGETDDMRGTPPPMLLFSAYGNLMFNDLPVILTQYSIEFPQGIDYVRYKGGQSQNSLIDGEAWLPAKFNITVNLTHQKSPEQHRKEFNWTDFRDGKLLQRGGGWW